MNRLIWLLLALLPGSALAEEGVISPGNLDLFSFVETADEAWAKIRTFYDLPCD